jgi:WD40 repeat protein
VIQTWDLVERQRGHHTDFRCDLTDLMFVRDDTTLVIVADPGDRLSLLDIHSFEAQPLFDTNYCGPARPLDFGLDGEAVIAAFVSEGPKRATIDICETQVDTLRENWLAQFDVNGQVTRLALRPGSPVMLAVQQGHCHIVLLLPGRVPSAIDLPHDARVTALKFAPDGQTLALRNSRQLWLWDVRERRLTAEIVGRSKFHAVAFSPDGRTLGIGTSDGAVRFYDVATGQQRAAYDWKIGPIHALAFAPDGMRAAVGGTGGAIVVWDVEA